ncbi:MAG: hypothetical protein LBP20_10790, partial [Treponema sp.]|nr:hypothetical protein [Treponema sp.]
MKKFFCFLLIIIAAGTVFFLGWAQLTVPPGSYGVMRSKTHGVDPRLIREGEFRWVWYKLIPTNVGITIFTPRHVERSICLAGTLPLGDAYGSMVGLDTDFSY